MPVGRWCQTTPRAEPGESAGHGARQQSRRVGGRASRASGLGPLNAAGGEGAAVDQGVEETAGRLFGPVVVAPRWKQDRCVARRAVEKAHAGTTLQKSTEVFRGSEQCYSLPKHGVFTQSGAAPDGFQRPLLPHSRFRQQVSASVSVL